MVDEKDDNSQAAFWEYVIAGIVILFFGALYWMLTREMPEVVDNVTPQTEAVAVSEAPPSRVALAYAEQAAAAPKSASVVAPERTAIADGVPAAGVDVVVERAEPQVQVELAKTEAVAAFGSVAAVSDSGDVVNEAAEVEVVNETAVVASESVTETAAVSVPSPQATNDLEAAITNRDAQTSFVFDALHFDTGSENIQPASRPQIEYVADVLKRYPDVRILIRGHTDNTGSIKGNAKLALDRSVSVGLALAALGVAKHRVEVESVGSNEPVAANDTAEGRRQNRRIELKIIE